MEDVATFALLRMLGPAAAGMLVSFMLWVPFVLYLVARWRLAREPGHDPQHGLKFALHYFGAVALQCVVASIAVLLATLISASPSEDRGDTYRVAFGLLIPAGGVLAGYLALLRRTNDRDFPGLRRLFTGFSLITTGGVAFVALLVGFQLLFKKGDTYGQGRFAAATILVYCAATALLALRLSRDSSPSPTARTDDEPPAPAPPAPSTPGLPPLGGGEFPPIEPPR